MDRSRKGTFVQLWSKMETSGLVSGGIGGLVVVVELGQLRALLGHAHARGLVAEVDLVAVPAQLPGHDDRYDAALGGRRAHSDDGRTERSRNAADGARVLGAVEELDRPGDLQVGVGGDRMDRPDLGLV